MTNCFGIRIILIDQFLPICSHRDVILQCGLEGRSVGRCNTWTLWESLVAWQVQHFLHQKLLFATDRPHLPTQLFNWPDTTLHSSLLTPFPIYSSAHLIPKLSHITQLTPLISLTPIFTFKLQTPNTNSCNVGLSGPNFPWLQGLLRGLLPTPVLRPSLFSTCGLKF